MVWSRGPTLFFCKWKFICPCIISWRDSFLFFLMELAPLSNINWPSIVWVYFWTLHSIALVCMSILMLCPPNFISFWTGKWLLNFSTLFSTLLYSLYPGNLVFVPGFSKPNIYNSINPPFSLSKKKRRKEIWKKSLSDHVYFGFQDCVLHWDCLKTYLETNLF